MWTTLVEVEEWILRRIGSATLESTVLIPKEGGLRLKGGVKAFLRFIDKRMIATREVVTAGLAQACADGLVDIGRGTSLQTRWARYYRQPLSLDSNEDGAWIIPAFALEPAKVSRGEEPVGVGFSAGEPDAAGGTGVGAPSGETSGTATVTKPGARGTVCRFVVRGNVLFENWGALLGCFVHSAARMKLKKLQLGVQFQKVLHDDQRLSENDEASKAMKESARQLELELTTEE